MFFTVLPLCREGLHEKCHKFTEDSICNCNCHNAECVNKFIHSADNYFSEIQKEKNESLQILTEQQQEKE